MRFRRVPLNSPSVYSLYRFLDRYFSEYNDGSVLLLDGDAKLLRDFGISFVHLKVSRI